MVPADRAVATSFRLSVCLVGITMPPSAAVLAAIFSGTFQDLSDLRNGERYGLGYYH